MGFGGMPTTSNTFRMGNSSFGGGGGGASGVSGMGSMGIGTRSAMPGLGSGVPTPAGGLSLGGSTSLQTGGLGGGGARLGNNSFGGMQSAPTSYNPSGEILAMINKGQSLGLPPNQPLGMSAGLPPTLNQPGLQSQPGLGLGMGAGDLGPSAMGGVPSSPSFDLSEFPSLGQRSSATTSANMQQLRSQQVGGVPSMQGGLGMQGMTAPQSEFAIQSEDFPALPGAAPASSDSGGVCGATGVGVGGGGALGFSAGALGGAVDAALGLSKDGGVELPGGGVAGAADRYGLMGLLSVIRMTDQDLNTLALGTDLTTLGLNLNSSECLYATFASPWADSPAQRDPEFSLPQCYYMQPPALKTGHFSKFQLETLFYIFYNMPRDTLQAYAATELYNRDWRYHKDLKLWFTKASRAGSADTQKGQYIYFDINEWKKKMFHGAAGSGGGAGNGTDGDVGEAPGIEDL